MKRYINCKGMQGIETIDEINEDEFKSFREFRQECKSLLQNYRLLSMNIWLSSRSTKDWRKR